MAEPLSVTLHRFAAGCVSFVLLVTVSLATTGLYLDWPVWLVLAVGVTPAILTAIALSSYFRALYQAGGNLEDRLTLDYVDWARSQPLFSKDKLGGWALCLTSGGAATLARSRIWVKCGSRGRTPWSDEEIWANCARARWEKNPEIAQLMDGKSRLYDFTPLAMLARWLPLVGAVGLPALYLWFSFSLPNGALTASVIVPNLKYILPTVLVSGLFSVSWVPALTTFPWKPLGKVTYGNGVLSLAGRNHVRPSLLVSPVTSARTASRYDTRIIVHILGTGQQVQSLFLSFLPVKD